MTPTRPTEKPTLARSVQAFDELPDAALLSIEDIATLLGSGVSTTWRRAKSDPRFPPAVRIGPRCTRFAAGAVRAYLRGEVPA